MIRTLDELKREFKKARKIYTRAGDNTSVLVLKRLEFFYVEEALTPAPPKGPERQWRDALAEECGGRFQHLIYLANAAGVAGLRKARLDYPELFQNRETDNLAFLDAMRQIDQAHGIM